MGSKAFSLHRLHHGEPASPTATMDDLRRVVAATWADLAARISRRTARPQLGMIGVPLALMACLIADKWWALIPLSMCAWWWAPRAWGWEWVVALGRGIVGAEWAYLGATALAAFPGIHVVIEGIWLAFPVTYALAQAVPRTTAWR